MTERQTRTLSASAQLRRIIDGEADGTDFGLIFSLARQLLRDLDAATATAWTDPQAGTAYDLTVPLADSHAGGGNGCWHHVGWLQMPGEPRMPLMLWTGSPQLVSGSIRRMSDLATLRDVIDDWGPLTPATTTTEESTR